jgi:hypothetical protein
MDWQAPPVTDTGTSRRPGPPERPSLRQMFEFGRPIGSNAGAVAAENVSGPGEAATHARRRTPGRTGPTRLLLLPVSEPEMAKKEEAQDHRRHANPDRGDSEPGDDGAGARPALPVLSDSDQREQHADERPDKQTSEDQWRDNEIDSWD